MGEHQRDIDVEAEIETLEAEIEKMDRDDIQREVKKKKVATLKKIGDFVK